MENVNHHNHKQDVSSEPPSVALCLDKDETISTKYHMSTTIKVRNSCTASQRTGTWD